MIQPKSFFNLLKSQGIDFFVGVPDSLLKNFCFYIDDHTKKHQHIIAANEGSAIAIGAGYNLATGKIPLVYMQNSGLGNAINPLVSLVDKDVYQIPLMLLIGWRGEFGILDEPQHQKMGIVTLPILDSIGIPHLILSDNIDEAEKDIINVCKNIKKDSSPYAIIVQKDTFEEYISKKEKQINELLSREEALEIVINSIQKDAAIISTTGKLSRELFEIRNRYDLDHSRDFLTVGSMGHASQIALGISLAQSDRSVYCLDGDGAALMHLGGLAVIGQQSPRNFRHILFNNGMHESVGGQKTAGFDVNFCDIATACGYRKALSVSSAEEIKNLFKKMSEDEGPIFIEIRIKGGSRSNLGRPTQKPKENKKNFENFLRG